jgi:internalin A
VSIVLSLEDNSIADISPLSGMGYLGELNLSGNQVTDITALVENEGIGNGDIADITYNPFDCEDAVTLDNIAALEERGVSLEHDCAL